MKNIYKSAFAVKLKDLNTDDLKKIKTSESLKERSKDSKTNSRIKSLSTFQTIFDNQEKAYHLVDKRFYFFRIRIDKRDVPASVIKEEVNELIKKHIENEGNPPAKKIISGFKEDVEHSLIPKAFIKSSFLDFCIDSEKNILIANVSSPNKINDIFTLIREHTDLNYELIEPEMDISTILTEWLKKAEADEPFEIEDFVSLEEIATGGVTQHKNEPISNMQEEIESNLKHNKIVKSMKLNWHERIEFILNDQFVFKSIKTTDSFEEQVQGEIGESDHEITEFDSTMFNFISDIIEIIEDLKKVK